MHDEHQTDGYWKVLEPSWDRIDIYSGPERFLATYRSTPAVVLTLYAAHFCESEVSNGPAPELEGAPAARPAGCL